MTKVDLLGDLEINLWSISNERKINSNDLDKTIIKKNGQTIIVRIFSFSSSNPNNVTEEMEKYGYS